MNVIFEKMNLEHKSEVMQIFNYYILNTTSAFPQSELPEQFYNMLLEKSKGLSAYVLKESGTNMVIGFCSLNFYSPFKTFSTAATITYFIKESHTGLGLGTLALEKLEKDAVNFNIHNLTCALI